MFREIQNFHFQIIFVTKKMLKAAYFLYVINCIKKIIKQIKKILKIFHFYLLGYVKQIFYYVHKST